MEGVVETPPPECYNEIKKPSAYRVKRGNTVFNFAELKYQHNSTCAIDDYAKDGGPGEV